MNALRAQPLTGIPEVREERNAEQQARWLLAYLLDFHNREATAVWWEYLRLRRLGVRRARPHELRFRKNT